MKGFFLIALISIASISYYTFSNQNAKTYQFPIDDKLQAQFKESELQGKIAYDIFQTALKGFNTFKFKSNKIVIIDFNKASTEKRLYVIDLDSLTILKNTLVAHGKNTGNNYAKHFSNDEGSYKSSLGFYRTAETYQGKHGYSLRLDGLEKGINDHARKRAIVIHGADYVSQEFINKNGRLGRSFGCPALPKDISKEVIDLIKNGSCLFIYKKDKYYFNKSAILNVK